MLRKRSKTHSSSVKWATYTRLRLTAALHRKDMKLQWGRRSTICSGLWIKLFFITPFITLKQTWTSMLENVWSFSYFWEGSTNFFLLVKCSNRDKQLSALRLILISVGFFGGEMCQLGSKSMTDIFITNITSSE